MRYPYVSTFVGRLSILNGDIEPGYQLIYLEITEISFIRP